MSTQFSKNQRDPPDVDFAIITALPEEFRATCQYLKGVKRASNIVGVEVYKCLLPVSDTRALRGTIIQPMATGRVEAAVAATFVMLNYSPRIIAVIGIAGGLKWIRGGEKLSLGDVVFADRFVDTEYRKIFADREEPRIREYPVSRDWIRYFEEFREEDGWWLRRSLSREGESSRHARPALHIGSVISASSVIARRGVQHSILSHVRSTGRESDILAVEMEAVGVAVAASRLGYADRVMMFRGINDYADEAKNTDELEWRHAATDNAAAAGVSFIRYCARGNQWGGYPMRDSGSLP